MNNPDFRDEDARTAQQLEAYARGGQKVQELLGKTATDFETPEQVEARVAREDFAQGTVLPDNNTGRQ